MSIANHMFISLRIDKFGLLAANQRGFRELLPIRFGGQDRQIGLAVSMTASSKLRPRGYRTWADTFSLLPTSTSRSSPALGG